MSEVVELIYGRNEAESFENSKKSKEWILAEQMNSWQSRGVLPYCHSAHEGSFLQHTAVTRAPWREDEPVWGTLLCRSFEKPEGLLEYCICRWSWLLGRRDLDCFEASCKEQCGSMVWGVLFSWVLPAQLSRFGQKCSEPKCVWHWHVQLTIWKDQEQDHCFCRCLLSMWNCGAPVTQYLQCQGSSLVFTGQLWKTLPISLVHFSSELLLG